MRKVRKKVLRHAALKLYAVDACFMLLAITTTAEMSHARYRVRATSKAYSSPVVETVEAAEVEPNDFIPKEYQNLPYGYTAPTGFDYSDEELEEMKASENETEIESENNTESLIKSRDWDEGDVLMQIAMAEAEGESVEGKALVMLVVLNRVWTEGFPDGISEVVFEPGQFTPVENGRYYNVVPDEGCREAYDMVLHGWDESQGALYFASTDYAHTWHDQNCEYLFTEGKHAFYK